jgi:hypothetical protein
VLTQSRYDALVFARISSEYILDDDDGFRNYVRYLGLDKTKKSLDATVGGWFNFDG